MNLSHRAGLVLVLLGIIVFLRVWMSGKLSRAWAALNSPKASPGGTSGGGGASPGTAAGAPPLAGGVPSPALFGLASSTAFNGYGESVPGIAQADQAGLSAFHGGTFAHDFDYAGKPGDPVNLPLGATYKYLGDQTGGWGNLYGFAINGDPKQGVIEFPHIEGWTPPAVGTMESGGTNIGHVGAGPYSPQFWTGPHLAVIVDQAANDFLAMLGFTPKNQLIAGAGSGGHN